MFISRKNHGIRFTVLLRDSIVRYYLTVKKNTNMAKFSEAINVDNSTDSCFAGWNVRSTWLPCYT